MKTLQEMAILTILKFGIRYKEIVPTLLRNEIDTVEHTIRRSLTGSDCYEYFRVKQCLEFDISWRHGTWMDFRSEGFVRGQRLRPENRPYTGRQRNILVLGVGRCVRTPRGINLLGDR